MQRKLSAIINIEPQHHSIALLLPDFLDSNQYLKMEVFARELDKIGYATLRLDPCGLWYGDGKEEDYTVTGYFDDVLRAFELMRTKVKDPKDVLLLGHGLGAFMAVIAAEKIDEVTTVCALCPPATLDGLAMRDGWKEQGFKTSTRKVPHTVGETREFTLPYSTAEDMLRYSALGAIDKLTAKLMIYISRDDTDLPPSESERLVERAINPFVVKLNHMGHHFNNSIADTIKLWNYIKAFLTN